MENKRKHPRHPVTVDIKIAHPDFGEKTVKTRNISDGGLFIVIEPTEMPAVGEVVKGQVQGAAVDLPILDMEIVRVEEDGLGLKFVEV
jgi:hypothetical protein